MFCGCSRFRFGARVIYGTAVFIESVFLTSFSLSYVLQVTAVTLNYVNEFFCFAGQVSLTCVKTSAKKTYNCLPLLCQFVILFHRMYIFNSHCQIVLRISGNMLHKTRPM